LIFRPVQRGARPHRLPAPHVQPLQQDVCVSSFTLPFLSG
jgi:hypothetical protein